MSIEISTDNATLSQLQQTPIDAVLSSIDQSMVHLPTYRELYYRWERQQWRTQDIDFIADRIQWEDMAEKEQERYLYDMSPFFQGEASVTDALSPFVLAVPDAEMRLFLTTQLVDEARHTIFFNRFFDEVLGINEGRLEETLALTRAYMNPASRYLLIDALSEAANRIRQEPDNIAHLIRGVSLYHVIIEGTMALASQRALLETYRQDNIFPGFRGGFTAIARDESRHVIFGVKFLRDMIQQDAAHTGQMQAALAGFAPQAIQALMPREEMIADMLALGEDPWRRARYARQSLQKKLKVIGLGMELAAIPQAFNP
jgi:ribonucleoside-diphosphate reductase beta chain